MKKMILVLLLSGALLVSSTACRSWEKAAVIVGGAIILDSILNPPHYQCPRIWVPGHYEVIEYIYYVKRHGRLVEKREHRVVWVKGHYEYDPGCCDCYQCR